MEFFTKVKIPDYPFRISHKDRIVLMGSCFTENIGEQLKNYGFPITLNPFGIIYNPISIFGNFKSVIENKKYTAEELLYFNELYISLDHHGKFSGLHLQEVLKDINDAICKAHLDFITSKFIVFTLGTATIYHHKKQNRVVANCHKLPGTVFEKHLTTIEAVKNAYNQIKSHLADKTVLFTVSPVRHWRDGAIQNLRSKSILLESIHQLVDENDNCYYFPAFEIMMDELRDYRFYADDMLHPNNTAIKYIWERFSNSCFDEKTITINAAIEQLNLLLQHRIKNKGTQAEIAFEDKIKSEVAAFRNKYPEVDLNL